MSSLAPHLTIATYGCPSQSVEYYQILKEYLEHSMGTTVNLVHETDRLGPSVDRGDHHNIDAAFVSTQYGLSLQSSAPYSVLPVGAVTRHPGDPTMSLAGYWSVVLVRDDKNEKNIKGFLDLRGCKLAYSDKSSLSGVTALLSKLKQSGENAAFFSGIHHCRSHLSCIDALVNQEMDVAVVDSVALTNYLLLHPRLAGKVRHMYTWGPHPPHPIVVNAALSGAVRSRLQAALLALHPERCPEEALPWLKRLKPFGVLGFDTPTLEVAQTAVAMMEDCKTLSVDIIYY